MWLEFVFVVALVSTLGSLFYSEAAGFTPCVLCWYQRIAMYPQVVLAYLALTRKERGFIRLYLITLSLIGLVIAIYHNFLQWAPGVISAPCSIASAVDCAKRYAVAFDFITIPMMSLAAFALLLTILLVLGKKRK